MLDYPAYLVFDGKAGKIDCAVDWPKNTPRGWALVLHPHPLHGGTRNNKVVTTLARACIQHSLVVIRPNFRGVGKSDGTFDHAYGETADMLALVAQWRMRFPQFAQTPWVLSGFSFGTAVAAQLHTELANAVDNMLPAAIVLVGTAAQRFLCYSPYLPTDTLLLHGEDDEIIPLSEAELWAVSVGLTVMSVPGASHFFHSKLIDVRERMAAHLAKLLS